MYRLDRTEMCREHRDALLREASARRPGAEYPLEGKSSLASTVRRRAALLLSTMGLAVLLAAGVA